jgi:hypothetical protein
MAVLSMWTEPNRHKRNLAGDVGDHRPRPAIWFLALPLLAVLEVFLLFACGLVWIVRLLRWCLRPRPLVAIAFLSPWIVVFHVVWFAHGWSAFRPLCWRFQGSPSVELMGPMSVEATDAFHEFFVAWLGPNAERRSDAHHLDVRPAIRLMPTDVLLNSSGHLVIRFAKERGVLDERDMSPDDCRYVEEMLMEDGKAESYSSDWGYWPYNELNDVNSPLWRYFVYYHRSGPEA